MINPRVNQKLVSLLNMMHNFKSTEMVSILGAFSQDNCHGHDLQCWPINFSQALG